MNHFITKIHIEKLFHLGKIDILVSDTEMKHLLITGKNGSGKTLLLNAISLFLEKAVSNPSFMRTKENFKNYTLRLEKAEKEKNIDNLNTYNNGLKYISKTYDETFAKVELFFADYYSIYKSFEDDDFFYAFYEAHRKSEMKEPLNPTKPNLSKSKSIKKTATDQFLNFLLDLKIKEALARNEKLFDEADVIKKWFENFQELLSEIYDDPKLELKFNYQDYSFHICTDEKSFKFVELSDGYTAIIEIVADLILKMQREGGTVSSNFNKFGIVLIDEIETHLHLSLQRNILPFLTRVFPNVQFIVTTHSPFVLNSLKNVVAYDLENNKRIEDLSEYSYETLTTGYFKVETESSYLKIKLEKYISLCEKKELSVSEKAERDLLFKELEAIPHAISPKIVGKFETFNLMN